MAIDSTDQPFLVADIARIELNMLANPLAVPPIEYDYSNPRTFYFRSSGIFPSADRFSLYENIMNNICGRRFCDWDNDPFKRANIMRRTIENVGENTGQSRKIAQTGRIRQLLPRPCL